MTLHCYRYSWAQRAKALGYPERWAQQALGHSSKAVHRAYSDGGEIELPSLDAWEQERRGKIIRPDEFKFRSARSPDSGAAARMA